MECIIPIVNMVVKMEDFYDLGLRLKELRKTKRMTQRQVATRLNMGISTISGYENNTKTPSLEALVDLARLYNVSTDYLLGVDNRPMLYLDSLTPRQAELIREMRDEFRAR